MDARATKRENHDLVGQEQELRHDAEVEEAAGFSPSLAAVRRVSDQHGPLLVVRTADDADQFTVRGLSQAGLTHHEFPGWIIGDQAVAGPTSSVVP